MNLAVSKSDIKISPLAVEEAQKFEKIGFDFFHAEFVFDSLAQNVLHEDSDIGMDRVVISLEKLPDEIFEDVDRCIVLVLAEIIKSDLLVIVLFQKAVYEEGGQDAFSCARSSKQPKVP